MPTANDRFKSRFATWYWLGISAATVLHFLVLVGTPAFAAPRYDVDTPPPLIVQPPEAELPPAPAAIPRPALPVIGDDVLDPALTLPTIPFEQYVPQPPPAPRAGAADDALRERFEAFVPSMTPPRVLNADEVQRVLQQHYPPLLREAGIAGEVGVELWLDETGAIVRTRVGRSSGYTAMDAAALTVAEVMKLTPAKNRGRPVRVIVSVPVQFRVR